MFSVAHKWSRDHVKGLSAKNKLKPHSFHISISDSGVTGKSHAVKTIFYALTKFLLYDSNNPEKERMLLLGSTGISAVNINGSTNHSIVGIRSHEKYNKLGHKQKGWSEKQVEWTESY